MPYCHKCGKPVKESSQYCPECGFDLTSSKPKEKEEHSKHVTTEKIIVKEKGSSFFGNMIKVILTLAVIIGIILIIVYSLGEGSDGKLGKLVGCELNFKSCNRDCGEGLLGGLCKDKCAIEYNLCKKDK